LNANRSFDQIKNKFCHFKKYIFKKVTKKVLFSTQKKRKYNKNYLLLIMVGVNNKQAREQKKAQRVIPGARSLHRGIHVHENNDAVKSFMTNDKAKRNDHRDLMVHHQKMNDALQDIYQRTYKLEEENLGKDDVIEQRWRAFERVGGQRPKEKLKFAEHLEKVRGARAEERRRAEIERKTGDIDHSKGSALHDMKDRRVKKFVKRQLDRAHMLKRMGDPTPMKQSGKFDRFSGTLNLFNKTKRQVEREVQHRARESTVKAGRGGKRGGGRSSMWDIKDIDPSRNIIRDASSMIHLGRRKKQGGSRHSKKGKKSR
jgi:hypothetical protein